jgi:hypothetical protein
LGTCPRKGVGTPSILGYNRPQRVPLNNKVESSQRASLNWAYPAVVFTIWTAWVLKTYVPKAIKPFLDNWRDLDPIDRWRPVDVDLSGWNNGQTVVLTLELHAKPGSLVALQVADPVIYAKEEDVPKIAASPSAFDEATIARPVAVSFSPPVIRAAKPTS